MKNKVRIDELLFIADMSLEELANKSGVSLSTLKNWQKGTMPRNVKLVKKVFDVIGVSAEYFLGYSDKLVVFDFKLSDRQRQFIRSK